MRLELINEYIDRLHEQEATTTLKANVAAGGRADEIWRQLTDEEQEEAERQWMGRSINASWR